MIYNLLFFCFVDLLTSELVLIDPFMTGPITYAGLMTASSILSSSERMRERKHHKVTDRKKREKENINIIYWGEEKMPKVECTIILRNQPWQALTRNCRDDFVAANFMLSGIFFLINSSAFTNMRAVGVCLCNITVSHYRLILFLDRKFYTCWSLIWSHFFFKNMMYKYIFI